MNTDPYPEVTLTDLSRITHTYHLTPSNAPGPRTLIIRFVGEYGVGCKGNTDASYMTAVAAAGLAAWHPRRLIFDFRELEYVWGDMLTSVLCVGDARVSFLERLASEENPDLKNIQPANIPTAVVISDKCREGLTSLVAQEIGEDPAKWLFDSLEAAFAAVSNH